MDFLFPQFLYGLFALSIPIIIHLFHFRKVKKVYFSNTRFLRKVKEASQSRKKLKHYLILASRLLFLFFLVMVFVQPVINKQEAGLDGKQVSIYLDNSMSMGNEIANDTRALDEAIRYAQEILDFYPVGTRFRLLTNSFAPFSNAEKSKAEIEEHLTELQLTGITRSFTEIEQRMLQSGGSTESSATGKELFWISDFQKSTGGNLADLAYDTLHRYHWIPLSFSNDINIYVDSVYLDNPLMINKKKSSLKVVLSNDSDKEVSSLGVKAFINDIQSATTTIDIPAKGKTEATFDLAFGLKKINRCKIGFEDFPVTFDNEFYLSIDLSERISILEVKHREANNALGNVYGNKELFNFNSVFADNLNYSQIKNADLLIINGLEHMDPSLNIALNEYLQNFGSLAIIPSARAEAEAYQALIPQRITLPEASKEPQELAAPDLRNPFFENVFENTNENFSMPSAGRRLAWGRDRQALLQFKNGMPYLSSFKKGGNVFLFASPLEDEYTSLHRHAIFVPIMYRIAVSSSKKQKALYHTLDEQNLTLRMDSISKNDIFKLVREQEEVVPEQRVLGNRLIIGLPKHTLSAGFYQLSQRDNLFGELAFNNEKKESLLAQHELSVLETAAQGKTNVQVFATEDAVAFKRVIKERYEGTPLWRYALILALLFLFVEVLLARFLK